MKLTLEINALQDVIDGVEMLIDAYPADITLSLQDLLRKRRTPAHSETDEELTLSELSLYTAGQIAACSICISSGILTTEQAALILHLSVEQVQAMCAVCRTCGVVSQREAVREMFMEEARKSQNEEE